MIPPLLKRLSIMIPRLRLNYHCSTSAAGGEWRVAFAFDPKRKAILLVAGDKSGVSERRFYRELIRKADDRFDTHLARLKRGRK
jgi:hypothetical protein